MTRREHSNLPVPDALSSGSHLFASLLRGSNKWCVCTVLSCSVISFTNSVHRPAEARLYDSRQLGVRRYPRAFLSTQLHWLLADPLLVPALSTSCLHGLQTTVSSSFICILRTHNSLRCPSDTMLRRRRLGGLDT